MSAKFHDYILHVLVCIKFKRLFWYLAILTLTLDSWPGKFIESILSRETCAKFYENTLNLFSPTFTRYDAGMEHTPKEPKQHYYCKHGNFRVREFFAFFRENYPHAKIKPICLYEGNMSSIMKITPTWNVLPTFLRTFPPAKITTFTVFYCTSDKFLPIGLPEMHQWPLSEHSITPSDSGDNGRCLPLQYLSHDMKLRSQIKLVSKTLFLLNFPPSSLYQAKSLMTQYKLHDIHPSLTKATTLITHISLCKWRMDIM